MTLTRKEWLDMWTDCILIHKSLDNSKPHQVHPGTYSEISNQSITVIRKSVDDIKRKIESVLGQLENRV